jgi:mono/diheme cytochrome c family protein
LVLYQQNCAGCHGAEGKLGPAPPLNDKSFLDMVSEDILLRVISAGRPGTPMPAFAQEQGGMLTAKQVQILAESIKPRWSVPVPAYHDLPPYVAPKDKPGSREAGSRLFAVACAGCHGAQGQGGEHEGQPVGAINDPAFLALTSDQALRRYIITGRPDLGMPDYVGRVGRPAEFKPLTSQDITDLVALLAYWRHGGETNGK